MILGLKIFALLHTLVKKISAVGLKEETSKALALVVGRLRARIKSGMKENKTFINEGD
jgi:hypothetical protein